MLSSEMAMPLTISQAQFLQPHNRVMIPVLAVGSVQVKCVIRAGMDTVGLLSWRNKAKQVGEVQPMKFDDNSSCSRSQDTLPCQMRAGTPPSVALLSTEHYIPKMGN